MDVQGYNQAADKSGGTAGDGCAAVSVRTQSAADQPEK